MKALLTSIILIAFFSCKKEKVVCKGFTGSVIEQGLIANGESGLAAAINTQIETNGNTIRISCGNGMGRNNLKLGGYYIDTFDWPENEKPGIVLIDNTPFTENTSTGHPFQLTATESPVLNLFGANRQIKQKNGMETTIMNTTSIYLPRPFLVEGTNANAVNTVAGIDITWPIDPLNDSLYVIAYMHPNAGNNSILGVLTPVIKVIKTNDDGQFFLSNSELSQIPHNATFTVELARISYSLYPDSRNSQRKNLVIATTSTLKLLQKR